MIAGSGSQLSAYSRWGDYSAMSVDPADDCTFWYTTEYYATTSDRGWQTRVGSFKFPNCGGPSGFQANAQATPATGAVPLTVQFAATATGGHEPYSFAWAFGDGAAGTGASVGHTYSATGSYGAKVTVTDATAQTATSTTYVTVTVPPPVIASAQSMGNPFRIGLTGSNFHSSVTVKVSNFALSNFQIVGPTEILLKGGRGLKSLFLKGVPTPITVTNNDDGGTSAPYLFTR